jgi:hypothetical protein
VEQLDWSVLDQRLVDSPPPPGLLPHGLRRLQFTTTSFSSPLQPGSIPSTVQLLQIVEYRQPLLVNGVTVLPSSLVHLVSVTFNAPLLPGTLPPCLQRLCLCSWDQPLLMGALLASLRAVELTAFNHPLLPGALPEGLTHLTLRDFAQPLHVGVLPSSLVSLDLGCRFRHPLLPGALPPSLRLFWHARCSPHPLARGVLPAGLEFLHWWSVHADVDVASGVLPDGLQVVCLILAMGRRILPGAIPASVRWLGLPRWMEQSEQEMQLPPGVNVRRTC